MTRLFPHPRFSVALFIVWMLASNAVSLGTALLAALLAWGIPLLTHGFWPGAPVPRRPLVILWLLAIFGRDIIVANFSVARRVLGRNSHLRPKFVEVPLDLKDDFSITLLASMITLTPGTVSADVSPDKTHLLVHVLHTDDPEGIVTTIKHRYERRLGEILEW